MKYYKVIENEKMLYYGTQPNNIVPSFAVEITPEEYAQLQLESEIRQAKTADYVQKVQDGIITMDEVPAEYHDEVYSIVNVPDPEHETAASLLSEVSNYGY